MRKALLGTGILLGVAILLAAAGLAAVLWSSRRGLEKREAWIEAELRHHSRRAAALRDLDWPPYLEYLENVRRGVSKSSGIREILDWRAAGCPMGDWTAAFDVGFRNRHWPFIFGLPPHDGVSFFLRTGPVAQDVYRGGGFYCSLFRTAEEVELHCQWRGQLEKNLVTAAELDQCVQVIDRLEASRPSFRDELEVEHLLRCRDVLRIYHTSKDPEGLIESQKPGWRSLYSREVLFSQLLSRLDDQRDRALTLSSQPLPELWRRLSESDLLPEPTFRAFASVEWCIFRYEAQSSQRRQLLRTALAVARYGAANGKHPAGLEDLIPTYLPSIPRSPLTGAPLSYANGTVAADVEDHLQKWTVKAPAEAR